MIDPKVSAHFRKLGLKGGAARNKALPKKERIRIAKLGQKALRQKLA